MRKKIDEGKRRILGTFLTSKERQNKPEETDEESFKKPEETKKEEKGERI